MVGRIDHHRFAAAQRPVHHHQVGAALLADNQERCTGDGGAPDLDFSRRDRPLLRLSWLQDTQFLWRAGAGASRQRHAGHEEPGQRQAPHQPAGATAKIEQHILSIASA